eukprot:1128428_1
MSSCYHNALDPLSMLTSTYHGFKSGHILINRVCKSTRNRSLMAIKIKQRDNLLRRQWIKRYIIALQIYIGCNESKTLVAQSTMECHSNDGSQYNTKLNTKQCREVGHITISR